jgi:hypothetical protein
MDSERQNFGYGAAALLLLCGSYIVLGIGLFSEVKETYKKANIIYSGDWDHSYEPTSTLILFPGIMYFIALLLWTGAIYLIGLARGKDDDQFLVSLTSYIAFIPIITAFVVYVCGVSPFDIVEGLFPSLSKNTYIGHA